MPKRPEPHEIHAASRPRKGDPVIYRGEPHGTVHRVEGNLCWNELNGRCDPFIWCFREGLNTMHDWPTKHGKDSGP